MLANTVLTNTVDSTKTIEIEERRPTPCDQYDCIWCHKGQSGCSGQCLCPRKPRYSVIDDKCGAFRRGTRDNIRDTVTMMIPVGDNIQLIEWKNVGTTKARFPKYYDYTILGYYDRYALVSEAGKPKKTSVDYNRLLDYLKLEPGEPIVGNISLKEYQKQIGVVPREPEPKHYVEEQMTIFDLVAEDVVLLEKIGLGPKKKK